MVARVGSHHNVLLSDGLLNLETPFGILRRAGMLWDREVPEGTEPARHRSVQLSQRFAIEESGLEGVELILGGGCGAVWVARQAHLEGAVVDERPKRIWRSEEHTSELQSLTNLVCRL